MDLISSYDSDSDASNNSTSKPSSCTTSHVTSATQPVAVSSILPVPIINAAPHILPSLKSLMTPLHTEYINSSLFESQPLQGPMPASFNSTALTLQSSSVNSSQRNHFLGNVDQSFIDPATFNRRFTHFSQNLAQIQKQQTAQKKRKENAANANANTSSATDTATTPDNKKVKSKTEPEQKSASKTFVESTELHAASLYDYQGRSYLSIPTDVRLKDWLNSSAYIDPTQFANTVVSNSNSSAPRCYVPKQTIHTFTGHTGPVQCLQFMPRSGHLLFSASYDQTVKIWNCNSQNRDYSCVRTIKAHEAAIRDLQLTSDGHRFITVSFDRSVKYFDSETGQLINSYNTKAKSIMPYCAKFNPSNESETLIGQSNKLIVQYDWRSNTITQEYNEHLGAVNSITFIDSNNKFVTTSDDKKVFIWELNIPIVIKQITDPSMHSVPVTRLHPSQKYFVGQSLDNQILSFNVGEEKFKLNRKKRFIGHLNSGYAIGLCFSPDGSFLVSGDAEGRTFIWDWKTGKVLNKLHGHQQVSMAVEWNPNETSKLATSSWDGTIKYWD